MWGEGGFSSVDEEERGITTESFEVTLSAQSALYNALCQFLWFSEIVLLIILIKFLFVDYARPFP
jgi:hypothetical protein